MSVGFHACGLLRTSLCIPDHEGQTMSKTNPNIMKTHTPFNGDKGSGRAWLLTIMLVIFQIIAFADKAVLGLVAPYAIPDLGITSVQFGFIGSAFFFLYAIASVVAGIAASRYSAKWILFILGVIWAVTQFPMWLGGGALVLLITRIILGAGEGPATAMSLTFVHGWFKPEQRALPSNMVAVGSTLGPVIAAPVLTLIIVGWGWRWAFGILGFVGIAWLIAWAIMAKDGPYSNTNIQKTKETRPTGDEVDTKDIDEQAPVSIWKALLSLTFIAAVMGGASNFFVQGFLTTWLPQYLNGVIGLDLAQVGAVTMLPWMLGAAVLLVLGLMGHKMMKRGRNVHQSIAMPFGISAVIAGIAFLLVQTSTGAGAIAFLTIGAGFSLIYPMTASAVGFAVGPKQRPILMATLGGVSSVGAIFSPTLVGWLMDKAGYQPAPKGEPVPPAMVDAMATGMHQALTITGILLLIGGTMCILFLRPERLAAKLRKAA
ncbi:MFS transporter [Pseudoglutamicibacter albus]|uniref:MFS transporter n=1 Tax=Pseudoglutamicibacter albus TaxID=98671 RepID=UPI001EF64DCC|nr:MFS transporter [Pseudoglutamicibacter albus]MCG7304461.1 MFS transporter [Pseudoglutamicibacter albus]